MARQGTSSQYQYCYLDLVIWFCLSLFVTICQLNQFNSIQIVRRQCCLSMADIFSVTSLVVGCAVRMWWCDHVQSDNNRSSLLTHSALRCVVGLYLSLIALIQHRAPLIMKCVWYVRRVWKPQIWYYSTEHWAAQLIKGAWLVALHLQWCVQKIGHVCSTHRGWVTVHFREHYTSALHY